MSVDIYSQFSIDNDMPEIGDNTQYYNVLNSNVGPQDPGGSGSNQLWEFSPLFGSISTGNYSVYSPSLLQGLPDSLEVDFCNSLSCYSATSNEYSLRFQGNNSGNPSKTIYTNPRVEMVFPLEFMDSFIDEYEAIRYDYNGVEVAQITGAVTVDYDGFGQLILNDINNSPYVDLDNMSRLHVQLEYSILNLATMDVVNYTSDTYKWYRIGIPYYLFFIQNIYTEGEFSYTRFGHLSLPLFDSIGETSTEENDVSSSRVYPNPAKDELRVEMSNTHGATISITDIAGRIVRVIHLEGNDSFVDVSELISGIYFVTVEFEDFKSVQRIIKE